jgi:hypothetical protein
MALKRYTASADTTIANAYEPNLITRATGSNMGASDVLDVFSIYGRQSTSSAEISRVLLKFPVTGISTDRTNSVIPASGSVDFYLRLYNAAHSKTVPKDAKYVFMMVSQSWQEGVGLDMEGYSDLTLGNEGSNWMSASNSAYWKDINNTLLAGGSYHTQSGAPSNQVNTEIFIFDKTLSSGTEDIEINITPWIEQWIAGTYSNYGLGVMLTSSQEASSSVDALAGKASGRADDDGEMQNPSGSTTSYYIKRFFGRGSQYFYKRPVIEARWNDITRDDRGNFYYSSSLASADDNLNTIYFYNYVRGRLADIPNLGADKRVYVSIYSGSVGGDYINGGEADDVPPSDIPVSGATSANTGSVQLLSADNAGHVRSSYLTAITGGIVSTGVYSASFAFTGSKNPTVLKTIYDVWYTGSNKITNASDADTQFYTGSIVPKILNAMPSSQKPSYYINLMNVKQAYYQNETVRFNLYIREKNWNPNIYTKARSTIETTTVQSASYRVYRLMDGYEAVSYGTGSELHTGLSYDESGNYFDFDMSLLEPGYAYAFKFAFYDSAVGSWIEQSEAFKFRVAEYEY